MSISKNVFKALITTRLSSLGRHNLCSLWQCSSIKPNSAKILIYNVLDVFKIAALYIPYYQRCDEGLCRSDDVFPRRK